MGPEKLVIVNTISRILLQAFLAFVLAILITPIYTFLAFKYKAWKKIRSNATTGEKAPVFYKLHAEKHKRNIPTMAGIIIVSAVTIVSIVFNFYRPVKLLLFGLLGAGLVGLIDDWINIRGSGKGIAGMRSALKFVLILIVAILGGLYFYFKLGYNAIHVPAVGDFTIGILYIPLFILVVVSSANAVNITDGLDGLSGGLLAIAFGSFGVISYLTGYYAIAGFCAALVGGVLAYTWFNIFPARFFMGDIGSFALGTALGMIAMLTNQVFVLVIVGGVFVAEASSSLIQILSKKIFKKKIFISAPLHHHLEAKGWPETKVTMRLWIIGAVAGVIGILIGILARGR
jgi:phospho-N-acetylmuramoyl-pentapeptide-transferase